MISILDHGADPTGQTGSTAAINAALLAAAGEAVYAPPGRYWIDGHGLRLPSGTRLVGTGGTWFTRRGPGHPQGSNYLGGSMIECGHEDPNGIVANNTRVENVSIVDVGFEEEGPVPFATAISCFESKDIFVDRCRMRFLSPWPEVSVLTLHAFLAKGCSGVIVDRCVTDGGQILPSGGAGVRGATVRRCRMRNARNFGVSCVAPSGAARIEDVLIEDNIIEDPPQAGGIFFGSDNAANLVGLIRGVKVRRNTTTGAWADPAGGGVGVFFRPGLVSEGVEIEDNAVIGDGGPGTGIGVKMDGVDPDCEIRGLVVNRNIVRGMRGHDSFLAFSLQGGDVYGAEVLGNRVYGIPGNPALGGAIRIGRGRWHDLQLDCNESWDSRGHGIELWVPRPTDSFDRPRIGGANRVSNSLAEPFVLTKRWGGANTEQIVARFA